MAKMLRDGDAEGVAERQQMVVAQTTTVRAEGEVRVRQRGGLSCLAGCLES